MRCPLPWTCHLVALGLVIVGCRESVGPERGSPRALELDVVATQNNGWFGASGTRIPRAFNPTNPHLGDAVIASFFWLGSTNIITSVTDHLATGSLTPVGNTYTLVEFVTAGGISMATYVATNVQNFPDAYSAPAQDSILVVEAELSSPVTDAGVLVSAYRGVYPAAVQAVGAHQSASGSGASITTADPGAIAVSAGGLAYSVTLSNGVVGVAGPAGFTNISAGPISNASLVAAGAYAVPAAASTLDPQWTWYFNAPSTWVASVLALNDAPTKLAFTGQPGNSLPCPGTIPPVAVTAQDDEGFTVTTFNGPMTIAIAHNAGLLMPGKLSGTVTVAAVNGVARFSDLCIDQPNLPGNGYTLQATAPELKLSVASAPFSIGSSINALPASMEASWR